MSEDRHDPALADILALEGNSLPNFFNAVFGFLSRHCPDEIYGSTQISGEHLVSQSYSRWRQRYIDKKAQEILETPHCDSKDGIPVVVAEEVVLTTQKDNDIQQKTVTTTTTKAQDNTPKLEDKEDVKANGDEKQTSRGLDHKDYSWTQTIEDLEVRVIVAEGIKKGKQVRVKLQTGLMEVCVDEDSRGVWQTVMGGKFPYEVRAEECMWSLVPGEHISIHLEKSEERWWERLLTAEDPIDVSKIETERDFSTLPEEERQRIRELMWNHQMKQEGKQTSDQKKLEGVLREAWDAEGSPFKGQPYDPAVIDLAASGNIFGNT